MSGVDKTTGRGRHIPEAMVNGMSLAEIQSAFEGAPLSHLTTQAVIRRLIEIAERAQNQGSV